MTIGIDISQTVYQGTGTAVYTGNLVTNLLSLDQKNSYILFGSNLRRIKAFSSPETGFDPGNRARVSQKIFPFPPTVLDFVWNRLHVLPVENLIGPVDIFHSSDWTQPPARAKKVTPILDMVVYKYPQSTHPQIVAVQKRRMALAKKEADMIITISECSKKDIVEILKIPPEKIRVIYPAAGPEFKPQKSALRKDYILTIGSPANRRKNVAVVISACQKENLPLKIIDGTTSQKDLPDLYANARCFVYASLYEGFGLPIVEALACGTPVICGRNSSLVEAGGDAVTYADVASVDDLADKISRVEPTGREITQAEKFSWTKTAAATLAVYNELFAR